MAKITNSSLEADPKAHVSIASAGTYPHKYFRVKEPHLKNSLAPKVRGPYEVVGSELPVIFIKVEGVTQSINIDRCKPAFLLKDKSLYQELPEPKLVKRKDFKPIESTTDEKEIETDIIARNIGELDKSYRNTRFKKLDKRTFQKQDLNPKIFLDRCDA